MATFRPGDRVTLRTVPSEESHAGIEVGSCGIVREVAVQRSRANPIGEIVLMVEWDHLQAITTVYPRHIVRATPRV